MSNNDIVQRYIVKGDSSGAQKAAKGFEKASSEAFLKAGKSAVIYNKLLDLGLMAVRKTFSEMQRGVKLAMEYEKTNIALRHAAGQYTDTLNEESAALESVTNISDEVIRSMQTMAISTGVNKEEATEFIKAAVRMSNVTGKDVRASFDQLIMTLGGSAAMIGRVIPDVKNLTQEELKAGGAIDLVNKKFDNFLDLESRGLSGKVKSLATQWDNVAEAIGMAATNSRDFNTLMEGLGGTLAEIARVIGDEGIGAAGLDFLGMLMIPGYGEKLAAVAEAAENARSARIAAEQGAQARLKSDQRAAGIFDFEGEKTGGDLGVLGSKKGKGDKPKGPAFSMDWDGQYELFVAEEERKDSVLVEIEARRLSRKEEADELMNTHLEGVGDYQLNLWRQIADEQEAIEEEKAAKIEAVQKRMYSTMETLGRSFARASSQALLATIQGDELAFKKMIRQFLEAKGTMLFGQGIIDSFMGLGRAIWTPADPSGWALASLGAQELLAGGAMMGGSLAISVPGQSSGGGGGGGLGAGGSVYGGSGGGQQAEGQGGSQVINVYGATTDAETMAMIRRAQEEGYRSGML